MSLSEALLAAVLLATAGAGHCLGMCGVLSMNISFAVPEAHRNVRGLLYWHTLVNAGRISCYALLGALSGGAGAVLQQRLPQIMSVMMILAAAVLVLLSLHMLGRASGLQRLEALGQMLWQRVQPLMQKLLPLRSPWQALLLGAMWGFLPCGLIYSALLLATATSSPLHGALLMLVFASVTTVPVATSGIVAGRLSVLRAPLWRGLAACASILLAGYIAWQAVQPNPHAHHGQPSEHHNHSMH